MDNALVRPIVSAIIVALWFGPVVVGWCFGGNGVRYGFLVGGFLLASWLLAAWFSSAWRARFFTAAGIRRVTDEQVLCSAFGVVGISAVGYALLK
jgi:hypothetical protein